jgi:hypothetical protein
MPYSECQPCNITRLSEGETLFALAAAGFPVYALLMLALVVMRILELWRLPRA